MHKGRATIFASLIFTVFGCGGTSATVGGVDGSVDAPGNDATHGGDSASVSDSGGGDSTTDSGGGDSGSTSDSGGADSSTPQDSGTPTDSGIPTDSAVADSATDAGSTQCPSTEPAAGAPCPVPGLQCQYGTDPRGDCNPIATCAASGWQLSIPDPTCSTPPPTCPASPPTGTCSALNEACAYPGESCICACGPVCGSTGGLWQCSMTKNGCPGVPPNEGTACPSDGLECRYQCGPDGALTCNAGMWEFANGGPCPVSTRKAKTAVSYLSEADLALVARDVESMKLATWDYKNPRLNEGRRHMGIILEDEPEGARTRSILQPRWSTSTATRACSSRR